MSFVIKKGGSAEENQKKENMFWMANLEFYLMLDLATLHGWEDNITSDTECPIQNYFLSDLPLLIETIEKGVSNAKLIGNPVEGVTTGTQSISLESINDGTFLETLMKSMRSYNDDPDAREVLQTISKNKPLQDKLLRFTEWVKDAKVDTLFAIN